MIKIYAANGGYFRTLTDTQRYNPAGSYAVEWDGTNDDGKLASVEGDYRVEITLENASGESVTRNGIIVVYK